VRDVVNIVREANSKALAIRPNGLVRVWAGQRRFDNGHTELVGELAWAKASLPIAKIVSQLAACLFETPHQRQHIVGIGGWPSRLVGRAMALVLQKLWAIGDSFHFYRHKDFVLPRRLDL
jgi:hypothetical protein